MNGNFMYNLFKMVFNIDIPFFSRVICQKSSTDRTPLLTSKPATANQIANQIERAKEPLTNQVPEAVIRSNPKKPLFQLSGITNPYLNYHSKLAEKRRQQQRVGLKPRITAIRQSRKNRISSHPTPQYELVAPKAALVAPESPQHTIKNTKENAKHSKKDPLLKVIPGYFSPEMKEFYTKEYNKIFRNEIKPMNNIETEITTATPNIENSTETPRDQNKHHRRDPLLALIPEYLTKENKYPEPPSPEGILRKKVYLKRQSESKEIIDLSDPITDFQFPLNPKFLTQEQIVNPTSFSDNPQPIPHYINKPERVQPINQGKSISNQKPLNPQIYLQSPKNLPRINEIRKSRKDRILSHHQTSKKVQLHKTSKNALPTTTETPINSENLNRQPQNPSEIVDRMVIIPKNPIHTSESQIMPRDPLSVLIPPDTEPLSVLTPPNNTEKEIDPFSVDILPSSSPNVVKSSSTTKISKGLRPAIKKMKNTHSKNRGSQFPLNPGFNLQGTIKIEAFPKVSGGKTVEFPELVGNKKYQQRSLHHPSQITLS